MIVRLIKDVPDDKGGVIPAGTVNDTPGSYWWLELEIGEPVDDEAREHQKQREAKKAQLAAFITQKAEEAVAAHAEAQKEAEKQQRAEFEAKLLEGI